MNMIITKLLLISVIISFLIDLSGGVDDLVKPLLRRILKLNKGSNITLGPFECSTCTMFWTGLITLVVLEGFNLVGVSEVCLIAFLMPNITGFLRWCSDLLIKIEQLLYRILD